MSASNNSENDVAALRDDLAALKRDVAALIEHLKGSATNSVQGAAAQLDAGARGICRNVADGGQRSANALSQQIAEQPLVALMLAFSVGYIGARVLSR